MRGPLRLAVTTLLAVMVGQLGCNTAGSDWMAQPLDGELSSPPPPPTQQGAKATSGVDSRTRVIGEAPSDQPSRGALSSEVSPRAPSDGTVLGKFKNTYYDFPSEADFTGEPRSLMNASCKPIASVARGFYESVCVQGSGTLKAGGTVSFAKRDCACATECPRTGQRICFDLLDRAIFPWGRGATGKPITPLLTVAVDSTVIPLGTPLYIPEYDGIARDAGQSAAHDGCFLAEDRGLAVKGEHVDVFTGDQATTRLWNRLVPTGAGVTVVLDSRRCKRAG